MEIFLVFSLPGREKIVRINGGTGGEVIRFYFLCVDIKRLYYCIN